jgi:hypothetical protein
MKIQISLTLALIVQLGVLHVLDLIQINVHPVFLNITITIKVAYKHAQWDIIIMHQV